MKSIGTISMLLVFVISSPLAFDSTQAADMKSPAAAKPAAGPVKAPSQQVPAPVKAATQVGGTGQPCVPPNNTCSTGLSCTPEKTCAAQGAKGQPCFSNDTCTQALACGPLGPGVTNKTCDEAGTLYHPCKSGTCNAGMVCKASSFAGPNICYAAGGNLQPCLPPNNTCNSGLACSAGPGASGGQCFPAGAEGQLCLANKTCNSGLRCWGTTCVVAGAPGQMCLANNVCNSGLVCLGNCQKPPVIAAVTVPGQIKARQSATGTITLQEAMAACNLVKTCTPSITLNTACGAYACAPAGATPTSTCGQTADAACTAVPGYEVKLQVGSAGAATVPSVTLPSQVVVKRGATSADFTITIGATAGPSAFMVVASPVGGTPKVSIPITVTP